MTQTQSHCRIAFTVIDQDGNQRGDFPTRESAEAYFNFPPDFIDKERSRVAEFIDDGRGGHFTFPQSEDVWYGYCANSLYRVHRTPNHGSMTYRNTWFRRPLPNERLTIKDTTEEQIVAREVPKEVRVAAGVHFSKFKGETA